MAYHEEADPRTDKAPRHQASAKKKTDQTDLSNAEILPFKNKPEDPFIHLEEARKIMQALKSKDVPPEVRDKWVKRAEKLNLVAITTRIVDNTYTPIDIETLKLFIAEAEKGLSETTLPKRTRAKSEKEMEKQYLKATLSPYARRARDRLLSLGTKEASEWEVTGFNDLGEKASGACHLCGHAPIRYEYIITKMSGEFKGTNLKVGSECVVNYLDIDLKDVKELARKFEFEKQSDPDNVEKQLESLLDRIDRMTDLKSAYKHEKWEIYHKWKGKEKTVETSLKKLREKGSITPARLNKMLDMLKDAIQDEEIINESAEEKVKKAEETLKSDPLYEIMKESRPFHDKNSFIKDIYNKWVKRYSLTERQITAFTSAVEREKKEAEYGDNTIQEVDGTNTVTGIIAGFSTGTIRTKKGTYEKIIFDILTPKGAITSISSVEWEGQNYYQIRDIMDDTGVEHTVTIDYELADGRWRNLKNVVETDMPQAPIKISTPDPDLDISIFRGLDPRNWQSAHFMPWWNARRGIIQAGTGAGKTKFAIMAILKQLDDNPDARIVIAVPTMELQKQWKRELKAFGIKPTLVGGGHGKEFGQITIGIYNTLWEKKIVADLLIGDEAHHLSSNTEMNVGIWKDNLSTIDRILFLTATPGRHLMEDMAVIGVISQEELQAEGSLAKYSVTNLHLNLNSMDENRYHQLSVQIAMNIENYGEDHLFTKIVTGERYRWITNHEDKIEGTALLTKNLIDQGKKIIVFTTIIETMYIFEEAMAKHGIPVSIVHSTNPQYKMPAKVRAQNFADFADDTTKVLVGAFAISEGVDVPNADVAIILGGTSQERSFIQRSGRVLRVTEGKDTAEIFQIYMQGTMEAGWVTSRLKSIPRDTPVSDHEMEDYLNK